MLESLEHRRLLSAASLTSKGTLVITGTSQADIIGIRINSGGRTAAVITLDDSGQTAGENFRLSQIKRIYVEAAGGNDQIDLSNLPTKPAIILGGNGSDTLIAGPGEAQIAGGAGSDRLRSGTAVDASVSQTLGGGAGDDVLFGSSSIDQFDGGSGSDLGIDQILTRNEIRGKTAAQIKANLGDRASSMEGFDLSSLSDEIDLGNPKNTPPPPLFGSGGTTTSPGDSPTTPGGSIFEPPGSVIGGNAGSIFD